MPGSMPAFSAVDWGGPARRSPKKRRDASYPGLSMTFHFKRASNGQQPAWEGGNGTPSPPLIPALLGGELLGRGGLGLVVVLFPVVVLRPRLGALGQEVANVLRVVGG